MRARTPSGSCEVLPSLALAPALLGLLLAWCEALRLPGVARAALRWP